MRGISQKKKFASFAKLFVHPPTFKLCFAPLLNAICYIPQFVEGTSGGDKEKMREIFQKKFCSLRSPNFLSRHTLSNCVLRLCLTLYVILWRGQVEGTRKKSGDIAEKNIISGDISEK